MVNGHTLQSKKIRFLTPSFRNKPIAAGHELKNITFFGDAWTSSQAQISSGKAVA
jgi:hypothetical protein